MGFCLKTHSCKTPKDNNPSTLCHVRSRLCLEFLLPLKSDVLWDTQMAIAWSSRWLSRLWPQSGCRRLGARAHWRPIRLTPPLLPAAAHQCSAHARPSGGLSAWRRVMHLTDRDRAAQCGSPALRPPLLTWGRAQEHCQTAQSPGSAGLGTLSPQPPMGLREGRGTRDKFPPA